MQYLKNLKITFLGIGAPKCGTTWLTHCLSEHPQIFIPPRKEVNFFDKRERIGSYTKGIGWYKKFFDKPEAKNKILGEYTTHYIYHPGTADLIKKHFPDVKLLATLRKPWEMSYSLYKWKKANFTAADLPGKFDDMINLNSEFIDKAMYGKHLKKFYDTFPKENIFLILHDDIKKDPKEVLRNVYKFLGADSSYKPTSLLKRVNVAKEPRSRAIAKLVSLSIGLLRKLHFERLAQDLQSNTQLSKMYTLINKRQSEYLPLNNKSKEKLQKIFRNDIKTLSEITGRNLNRWLSDT